MCEYFFANLNHTETANAFCFVRVYMKQLNLLIQIPVITYYTKHFLVLED